MLRFTFLTFLSMVAFLFSASEYMFINEALDQQRQKKRAWTASEDRLLVSTVEKLGTKSWSKIAQRIDGRSGKQCNERYKNHLDPTVNKAAFTDEEEELLSVKIAEYQQEEIPWVKIATFFRVVGSDEEIISRRTDLQLRNHYHSKANKSLGKARVWKAGRKTTQAKSTETEVEAYKILPIAKRKIDISYVDIPPVPTQPFLGPLLLTQENLGALTFSTDIHQAITSEETSEEIIEKVKKPRLQRVTFAKKQPILSGIKILKDTIPLNDASWEKIPPVKSASSSIVEPELITTFPSPLVPIDFTNHDIDEYTDWFPEDPDLLALLARPISPFP